jgi:hypothetical protein
MSRSVSESTKLFKPFIAAGIILVAFGILCIWIGSDIITLKEEGEGFKIIGIRFLIGGIVSIAIGLISKYYILIRYILNQISYKIKPEENGRSDWHKR